MLPSLPEIRSGKNLFRIPSYDKYEIYTITNPTLLNILTPIFGNNAFYGFQVVFEGIAIHRDGNREIAYNYLIDNGGEGSCVTFYADDKTTLVASAHIPNNMWYRMNTKMLHGVEKLTRPRYGITINPRVRL